MTRSFVVFLALLAGCLAGSCPGRRSNSKLFCYYSKLTDVDNCYCTHAILPADSDVKAIERAREHLKGVKVLVTVNEFNQGLINLLKSSKVDGLEINLKKLDSKNDISDFISTVRSKLGSDLYLAVSVPSKAEILAKYYDFKSLSKHADLFILQTAFLGASKNVTFHPSRLSGMWDMQNTDSVVDLVSGLGAPLSKLVISAPIQAFRFTLQNEEYTAPGSPALEVESLTRNQLCDLMNGEGNWTLERDEDQAGPYIFKKNQWIAFEDSTSMDIKAKYSRVRGLAGMALKDVSQDGGDKCGPSILESAYNGLSKQARAPRGAVLHSLEREIREASLPSSSLHVSPFRISRIIDTEGKIHAVRQDTRTEFQCSRQGYFVHPRSCNRFYRCVKFDQLVDDFNVFEFDCPAGLAFDERVEVCVWPGSLPHGTPCSGSSEIAPVPRQRFECPAEQGYYADPENCRWFFACIDHGKSPLTAYEFRCPFGLVFDPEHLLCEWSWLVPKCAGGLGVNLASEYVYGGYSSGKGSAVLLEQYDGLGSLGAVKLGGITGKIEQPLVYSNVGTIGLGYNNGGYVNQGGYIVGNGLGGLSYKAAQSLQNAGLLKTGVENGVGIGYQAGGSVIGVGGQAIGTGGQVNVQYSQNTGLGSGVGLGYQAGGTVIGIGGQAIDTGGQVNVQYSQNAGLESGVGLGYQGGGTTIGIGGQGNVQYSQNAGLESGVGLGYQAGGTTIDVGGQDNVQYSQNAGLQSGVGLGYQVGGTTIGVGGQAIGIAGQAVGIANQADVQYSRVGSSSNSAGLGTSYQYQQNTGSSGASGLDIDAANLNIAGAYGTRTAGGLSTQYDGALGSNLNYNANILGTKSSQDELQYQRENYAGGLGTTQYQSNVASNLDFSAGQNSGTVNSGYGQGELNTIHLQGNAGLNLDLNGHGGATSSQSFTQYHGQSGQAVQANAGSGLENADVKVVVGNAGLNQEGYNSVQYQDNLESGLGFDAFGVKLNQGNVLGQVDFNQGGAAKSSQTFTQYHTGSTGQGVAGNINIIGGGYSAVGDSNSGVQVNDNGESIDTVIHATPSPVTVTTFASVPTVTSVPIPTLQTASGFESYKGGVVANIPQLQYKIQGADVANISDNFARFVSTTPSALLINEGYQYQRPTTVYSGIGQQNSGAGATSYSYQSLDTSVNQGAVYSNPTTLGQGVTVSGYRGSSTVRPSVAVVQQNIIPIGGTENSGGYVYSKPSIDFEEAPAKSVSSFSISSTARPVTLVQQQPVVSVQPLTTLQPVQPAKSVSSFSISSIAKPTTVAQQQRVVSVQRIAQQPAISTYQTQDFVAGGYNYEQPAVVFGERRQPQVVVSSTVQPIIKQEQVFVTSTSSPVVEQKIQVQPAVSSYSFTQNFGSEGYNYDKPSIAFEEKPVQTYQQVQPAIISKFSIRKPAVQPATVSTYNVQQPAIVQQAVVQPTVATYNYEQEYNSRGYEYSNPVVAYKETPTKQNTQPAVVSTYHYQQPVVSYKAPTYTYQKPAITRYTYQDVAQKAVAYQPNVISTYNYAVSSTPRPVVQQKTVTPAVISSYSYTSPTTSAPAFAVQNIEFGGYDYPKPAATFSEEPTPIVTSFENRQPVQEIPFVKKKAYVTGQSTSYQYNQRFDAPSTPVVVENYQASVAPVKATFAPVVEAKTPATPVVVENYQAPIKAYSQSVDTSNSYFYNNINSVSTTPVYQQEYYSTPVYQEPVNQVYVQTTPRPNYKSVISSVVGTKVQPTTQSPNFYYYDSRLSSTPKITSEEGYTYTRPKIQFDERPIRPVTSTTYLPPTRDYLPSQPSKPISSFSFSSLDAQYQTLSTPRPYTVSTTPLTREYIPVTTKVRVSTTPQPVFVVPEVSSTYVPVRSKIRYTTTRPVEFTEPAREYLPVSVTSSPVVSSTVPIAPLEVTTLSRDYLPVRARLRVTSTAPSLVDAGYGARKSSRVTIIKQNDLHPFLATKLGAQCTCVSNALNVRKKQKIIIVDDDDNDDGYVVANEGGRVVENYQYDPQDTVEITPTPQIYAQSTSQSLAAPSPTYGVRKRVRVRPVTAEPVSEVVDEGPSDGEIANAVRTGLKLVKQAAKEGAEEAIRGAGIRDTIDCQRAGLFRHPNQCNKFYSCKWDCTKNKFILHTFNCPVQLTFDSSLGACNWPSQGPACLENTLLPSE